MEFENLTPEQEKSLAEICCNPALFTKHFLKNRNKEPLDLWPHQIMSICDEADDIVNMGATDIGKSVEIAASILHFLSTTEGKEGIVIAPMTGHLNGIIREIEFQLDNNDVLKSFLHPERGIRKQPYYRIEFAGNSAVTFYPAKKAESGYPFKGEHVDQLWIEEAATIPEDAWGVIWQRRNKGGQIRVYCYPDGRRDTVFYGLAKGDVLKKTLLNISGKPGTSGLEAGRFELDTGWVLYKLPMMVRPDWDNEVYKKKKKEHKGDDTPDYVHMVKGKWGRPTKNAFILEAFFACQKTVPEYQIINITARDFEGITAEKELAKRVDQLLRTYKGLGSADYWLGGDLGYTSDPAELTVWRERNSIVRILRFHLEQIPYPTQAMIVAQLDRNFNFKGIGLDEGGNGLGVIQNLKTLDSFKDLPDLDERLIGIAFGSSVVYEIDDDDNEKKAPAKQFMTDLLNGLALDRLIVWPKQDELTENQYVSHQYHVSKSGKIVYSGGADHIIDSDRVFALARETILRLRDLDENLESVNPVSAGMTKSLY